jgi:hypothetical protein
VAFFRFSRDKRGYEYFYLVEPTTNRRGKVKPRVLYFYRTPPGVRVGREPFDEGVRRALEAQNPGVTFDWRSIVEAPIPSADAEKWRERRRAERAAKHAMASADVDDEPAEESVAGEPRDAPRDLSSGEVPSDVDAGDAVAEVSSQPATQHGVDPTRKRRRRRRGRRPGGAAMASGSPGEPVEVDAGQADHVEPADD